MLTNSETILYSRVSELHYGVRKTIDKMQEMLDSPDLLSTYTEDQLIAMKRELEELLYE